MRQEPITDSSRPQHPATRPVEVEVRIASPAEVTGGDILLGRRDSPWTFKVNFRSGPHALLAIALFADGKRAFSPPNTVLVAD